jgi:predicted nucleotidyltransferase
MSKKIDIISLYLGDYNKYITGREMARLLNLNHQTALNHLNELVSERILLFAQKGRNKEYYLNKESLAARQMVSVSEICKSISSLRNKEINMLIQDLIGLCGSILLFGSFASGKFEKDSDIDLIIIGAKKKESILKVKRNFPREVNMEFVSYNDLRKSLAQKKALAIEILKNHIIYGETYTVINVLFEFYSK